MTDANADPSGQQAQTPAQQAQANPQPPAEDWKKRYDGLVKKTEELVGQIKTLQDQLAAKTSEVEQLNGQLSLKDVEKSAAVGERDKTIQTLTQDQLAARQELERLRALELKIKVANEMGAPELIKLADTIPNMTDPEALKTVMGNIKEYADMAVKAREKQLLAGMPMTGGNNPASQPGPSTKEDWLAAIEKQPLGSRDRAKLIDEYGAWLEKTFGQ